MAEKNYITPCGYKRLIDEQEFFLKNERPRIVAIVTWAASLGDRSENADYQYGKRRLREIDSRLRFLQKRIDNASIVDAKTVVAKKIQFGATVLLVDEEELQKKYSIVGEDESNPSKGFISWKSPIGKSLLGKTISDSIVVSTPKGMVEFEVLEISYQDLDTGAFKAP